MPSFFLFDVHLQSGMSADEMLRAARRFGYTGICIYNEDEAIMPSPDLKLNLNPHIYMGIEIRTDSISELRRKLRHYWLRVPLIAVHGGEEKINMAAVKDHRVDVLTHPCGEKWEGKELKHQIPMLKYAARNGIAIEFDLNPIVKSRRSERVRILRRLHENLKLIRKYHVMPLLTTKTRSIYDLRAPREMIALASLCGMEREEAIKALSEIPAGILTRRWKKGREVELL